MDCLAVERQQSVANSNRNSQSTICQSLSSVLKPPSPQTKTKLTEVVQELPFQLVIFFLDTVQHKNTRSGLRSAVERALSNRTSVVILDALNNIKVRDLSAGWTFKVCIKGCRYEIWCLARTAATAYCLVHVNASEEICRKRNAESLNPYRPEMQDFYFNVCGNQVRMV